MNEQQEKLLRDLLVATRDKERISSPSTMLQPSNVPSWIQWIVFSVKDVGMPVVMSVGLVIVLCYLLLVQLPTMQADLRIQTDKLVNAVNQSNRIVDNNTTVMQEIRQEIKVRRQERWWKFPDGK